MEDNENNGKEIDSVQDPEYNQSNQNSNHLSQNMNLYSNYQGETLNNQSSELLQSQSQLNNMEKIKRHRRGKNEISDRNYRCPDCDKCYLSGPALTTHRKTKHGYGNNGEKRSRGRPRKDCLNECIVNNPQNKFLYFFNEEHRKSFDDKIIDVDIIKNDLRIIFKQLQKELFNEIDDVEKYPFYQLIVENWEKEEPNLVTECFNAINKLDEPLNKIQSYNLDGIFFFYLKEFYKNASIEYFWFMIKFIVLFRECINKLRANLVKKEEQSETNKLYSQIYNSEYVPEVCNDFVLDFMEPFDYFGLNKDELIEIIQHFCYWLYSKQYTQLHLSLINNK
jgi:hypothetical protein